MSEQKSSYTIRDFIPEIQERKMTAQEVEPEEESAEKEIVITDGEET